MRWARVPAALLEHPDVQPEHVALYAALSLSTDGGHAARVSNGELFARTGIRSHRRLYRYRADLRRWRFVRWEEEEGLPNVYVLGSG